MQGAQSLSWCLGGRRSQRGCAPLPTSAQVRLLREPQGGRVATCPACLPAVPRGGVALERQCFPGLWSGMFAWGWTGGPAVILG